MPRPIQDIHNVDDSGAYIAETDVTVPLPTSKPTSLDDPLIIRANVYRPKHGRPCPVLVTYGPYGKDIDYKYFHPKSFAEVNTDHKSQHSAWETPEPSFWTAKDYVVVRADERGTGQSPGHLDAISAAVTDAFVDLVEWAAVQSWSTGKVGLLGISYYAFTQWPVAARKPKGLAAIVPWEGMSDYYRDCACHGGILSDNFIKWWWDRQVVSNQYGLPGRAARNWGPDTIEGDLSADELERSRNDPSVDTAKHRYLDENYYTSRECRLEDIVCPLPSVANWGGNALHLRGNIHGFMRAGSKFKYLRCITGRHDLPFYHPDEVDVQISFLNAFLKGEDDRGWSFPGKVPAVSLAVRKGDPGFNNPAAELAAFSRREEPEWPVKDTVKLPGQTTTPSEIDLFLSIRHFDSAGKEIFYTGTTGEPTPVVKGWLRASLRAVNTESPCHKPDYLPWREYQSADVQPVDLDTPYTMDVEIWPTNVVVGKGSCLELQISSCDTNGSGLFTHNHPEDRPPSKLVGLNNIHVGGSFENYLRLPVVDRV
ncbi:hypothetical protein SCUCBS95973_001188 [Sporothrix curviconia]|uniref:Xaa-Pro dipeptidyl-peptidase C-terminal domain-containing protein n=1 Tax=Sporothrix curviconia TaxID=1260050 RepID=A0ABP0AWS2_9PEZI